MVTSTTVGGGGQRKQANKQAIAGGGGGGGDDGRAAFGSGEIRTALAPRDSTRVRPRNAARSSRGLAPESFRARRIAAGEPSRPWVSRRLVAQSDPGSVYSEVSLPLASGAYSQVSARETCSSPSRAADFRVSTDPSAARSSLPLPPLDAFRSTPAREVEAAGEI